MHAAPMFGVSWHIAPWKCACVFAAVQVNRSLRVPPCGSRLQRPHASGPRPKGRDLATSPGTCRAVMGRAMGAKTDLSPPCDQMVNMRLDCTSPLPAALLEGLWHAAACQFIINIGCVKIYVDPAISRGKLAFVVWRAAAGGTCARCHGSHEDDLITSAVHNTCNGFFLQLLTMVRVRSCRRARLRA